MNKFKFYKCVEIEHAPYIAWQSENVCSMKHCIEAQKTIQELIPTCETVTFPANDDNTFAWLHVIFHSYEDNALFCLFVGG